MERVLYKAHIDYSEKHWWFMGRRTIVKNLLARYLHTQNENFKIADVGSGAGSMISILNNFGEVTAIEPDVELAKYLQNRYDSKIEVINLNFEDFRPVQPYNLITFFDVLEHLENDDQILKKINSLLNNKGFFVCTVPAYNFLWGSNDEIAHHKRRYTKQDLTKKLEAAGFKIIRVSYFNFFFFPIITIIRLLDRFLPQQKIDFQIGGSFLNKILYKIFASESFLLNYVNLPFGISLFCLAQKIPNLDKN